MVNELNSIGNPYKIQLPQLPRHLSRRLLGVRIKTEYLELSTHSILSISELKTDIWRDQTYIWLKVTTSGDSQSTIFIYGIPYMKVVILKRRVMYRGYIYHIYAYTWG